MTLLAAALAVLVMVAVGMVLFRRLARLLLAGDAGTSLPEPDLLLLGVLPGLALVGTLATYLALLHLLRLWIALPLAAAIFWILRKDTSAVWTGLKQTAASIVKSLKRGNFFPILAILAGMIALAVALLLSKIPTDTADVWVYHIPIAHSFVTHAGFIYPQMTNFFYGNQPLFFELLSGTAMLAVFDPVSFDAVNIIVFFGLLLLLLSFARHARGIQFLVLLYFLCWEQHFLWDAAEPMIDLPRSCFSVAAFLFAYRYALNFRRFDLTMSALLAGAAVAGKYTELVTPLLVCATLAPLMARRRETWVHLVPASLVFVAVAGFWYLKNWILNANPIYPFLFAHPGLSNDWMKGYLLDISRPMNPADRVYSTNLLTARGWHDFITVVSYDFDYLFWPLVFGLISFLQPRPRRWLMPFWTGLLFVIWYAVMFNGTRWAVSAVLMLCATAFFAWAWFADVLVEIWNPQWPAMALRIVVQGVQRLAGFWPAIASISVIGMLIFTTIRFAEGHGNYILPRWMNRDMATALVSQRGMDHYLGEVKEGYAMYRYIGQHNLAHVFQPFDSGASFYASAYNNGHDNVWIIDHNTLPKSAAGAGLFLKRYDIHYFIVPDHIKPITVERLGQDHIALAEAIVASLKPHSKLIFSDGAGMSLYQIQ